MGEETQKIDALIREGKRLQARQAITALLFKQLTREQRYEIAQLARRVREPALAIRLLRPIIYPTARRPKSPPTGKEKAEYAANLVTLGSRSEALLLLKSIDGSVLPEKLLFESFAHFADWEHSQAIPLLRQYVEHSSLSAYQKIVGQVNLVSALIIAGFFEEAETSLNEIIEYGHKEKNLVVLQRGYQLKAGLHIYQSQWEAARKAVEIGCGLNTDQADPLFTKWETIALLFNESVNGARKIYNAARSKASSENNWEIVRDLDRFAAIRFEDSSLFLHLYFGTPFSEYRKRLKDSFPIAVLIPQFYQRVIQPSSVKPNALSRVFDLSKAQIEGTDTKLRKGMLHHRLILALASDFYRPFRIAEMFSLLFPDEQYNPISAPARIHQAIKGLREWSSKKNAGIVVSEEKHLYRLTSNCPLTIKMSLEFSGSPANGLNKKWIRLEPLLSKETFTTAEASKALGMSLRATRRFLSGAVGEGLLTRVGTNRSTVYSPTNFKKTG